MANLPSANIRLDFGGVDYPYYGIPFSLVDNPPLTPITFGTAGEDYSGESDCYDSTGKFTRPCSDLDTGSQYYPFPMSVVVEGDGNPDEPGNTSGDRHAIVIDNTKCMLYESYGTARGSGTFEVSSTAVFNLSQVLPQRPDGWTSADAAGLPILPGLLKYEEVARGEIKHAIRFTTPSAAMAYVYPASHFGPDYHKVFSYLHYGARLRLKSTFSESGYDNQTVILIKALKKYGMMFADQGSSYYLSGVSNAGWNDKFLEDVNQGSNRIHISNFDVVKSPFNIVYGWDVTTEVCKVGNGNTKLSHSFILMMSLIFILLI